MHRAHPNIRTARQTGRPLACTSSRRDWDTYQCVIIRLSFPLNASCFPPGPAILASKDCANVNVRYGRVESPTVGVGCRCPVYMDTGRSDSECRAYSLVRNSGGEGISCVVVADIAEPSRVQTRGPARGDRRTHVIPTTCRAQRQTQNLHCVPPIITLASPPPPSSSRRRHGRRSEREGGSTRRS